MSIQKYFPITESVRFQFRLDMFNAFNHTNFYAPNTTLGPRIWDDYATWTSAADAGSSQALLVMRGQQSGLLQLSAGCVLCVLPGVASPQQPDQFESLLASAQDAQARSDFQNRRRVLPASGQASILKSPNSEPISG